MSPVPVNLGMSAGAEHIPPSVWTGHVPFAFWVIEETRPRVLVELGTYRGTSYLAFCQAVRHCGLETACHAVDTWQGDPHSGFYGDEIFDALSAQNQAANGGFSTLWRMTFDQALAQFADGSIDLLHIDGLHFYEAVRHDFESWRPKLSDRAVVLFHDTMERDREFGVWRLWQELREEFEGFEFEHAHGLGVLLVGGTQTASLRALAAASASPDAVAVRRLFEALGARLTTAEALRAAEAEVARIEGLRGAADADVEKIEAVRAACRAEIAQLTATLAADRAAAALRLADIETAHAAAVRRLESDCRAQSAALETVLHSKSWRITGPARWLARQLR